MRTIDVDLGGGAEELTVRIVGKGCRVQDAQDQIVALLRRTLRNLNLPTQIEEPPPCGCKDNPVDAD